MDEQTSGPFAVWRHAHCFEPQAIAATLMRDVIDFAAPYGPLGRLTEILLLDRYMTKLIATRNQYLATTCQANRSAEKSSPTRANDGRDHFSDTR